MALGATHHRVRHRVRQEAAALAELVGGTWNSYENHPSPYWLDDVCVDVWGSHGRGDPIGRENGWRVTRRVIHRAHILPVCYIRFMGQLWTPARGWEPFQPDEHLHRDHPHIKYAIRSLTRGAPCPWCGS